MSVKQSSAYCPVCGRQSLFQKARINHVLHLILSIITLGVWAFVWLFIGITNSARRPRCVTCGTEMPLGGSFKQPVAHEQVQAHVEAHPHVPEHPYPVAPPPDPSRALPPESDPKETS